MTLLLTPLLLHCVVVSDFFLTRMDGYIANEESRVESQGEYSHNSQWIEDMRLSFFKSKQSFISEMLHGPNLLHAPSNIF